MKSASVTLDTGTGNQLTGCECVSYWKVDSVDGHMAGLFSFLLLPEVDVSHVMQCAK